MTVHLQAEMSQLVYRAVLNAMSHPGSCFELPVEACMGPTNALIAVCRTLMDHEVTFVVFPCPQAEETTETIHKKTKAKPAARHVADFAINFGPNSEGRIAELKCGIPEYPDQNATVIYYIENPSDHFCRGIELSGPGILDSVQPQMTGLSEEELCLLCEINDFPLGIDAIFVKPSGEVMAVPRSSRVERKEVNEWPM